MSECLHDYSKLSTLVILRIPETEDTPPMWWANCNACGKHTQPCLTFEEARLRGLKEWWA